MKRKTYEVSGSWATVVTIEAPDDTPDETMELAAGDHFEEGFSLKDFMRGLDHTPTEEEESSYVLVIDRLGNVDWDASHDKDWEEPS